MPSIVPFNTIPEMFGNLAEHYAASNRIALRFKDKKTKEWKEISWGEYRENARAVAAYLYSKGVRKGDRVAILSENRPEWVFMDWGTQMLGGINVSLYTTLPPAEVAYILNDSGAKVFLVSTGIQLKKAEQIFDECGALQEVISMTAPKKERAEYITLWDEVLEKGKVAWEKYGDEILAAQASLTEEDLSKLIYTSGTTGNPKGVMLTHKNLCSNIHACLQVIDLREQEHHLCFLPLSHSFETTGGYHAVLAAGGKISYAESVEAVSNNLLEVCPTVMISVPRLFERVYNVIAKSVEDGSPTKKQIFNWAVETGKKVARVKSVGKKPNFLLKAQYQLAHKLVFAKLHAKLGGNVRFAVSGGAALPKAICEFFQAAGVDIIEGYGLTETSPVVTINPQIRPVPGTVGHVIPGVTIAIQSNDGTILGQLRGEDYPSNLTTIEGEILFKGPNIMKGYWNKPEATAEVLDADGWLHSGDVGKFEDGYLRITDRIKHMLVSKGGKNIYPGPIEEKFKTNPYIEQIHVVGEAREYLTALVVPNMENLIGYAKSSELAYEKPSDLLEKKEILALYKSAFDAYSKTAASHEKIREFRLIPEPFTVENGMMTPTMKLKRKIIEANFVELIEKMYEGVV